MKKIAIEEHFRTESYIKFLMGREGYPRLELVKDETDQAVYREYRTAGEFSTWVPRAISRLCDIGEGRIRDMDDAEVDMQVLAFPPGIDMFEAEDGAILAQKINDELSAAVTKHPARFAGLAALPLKDPVRAVDELERSVKYLGLKGAMIFPHVEGEFIDSKKYWPIFEGAANLNVPLYIHPTYPPPERQQQYTGYPALAGSLWGFAAETGLAAMRLILSGIFDEYTNLQIILGHLGESLPWWIWRLDSRKMNAVSKLMIVPSNGKNASSQIMTETPKKLPSYYIKNNFLFTTSGMFWPPAILYSVLTLGADRIFFAVDYPMESSQEAIQALNNTPISNADKEKIFHINAEKLFGL